MPNVSIVIPTYNRQQFLLEALRSVFAQTFQDYEVIVVDDGSTDQTAGAVQSFGDRVVYLYKTHGGAASARNRGLRRREENIWRFSIRMISGSLLF